MIASSSPACAYRSAFVGSFSSSRTTPEPSDTLSTAASPVFQTRPPQPLLAVLFAALLINERPSPLQLVGAAFILSGLLIASIGRRQRPLETVPEH